MYEKKLANMEIMGRLLMVVLFRNNCIEIGNFLSYIAMLVILQLYHYLNCLMLVIF